MFSYFFIQSNVQSRQYSQIEFIKHKQKGRDENLYLLSWKSFFNFFVVDKFGNKAHKHYYSKHDKIPNVAFFVLINTCVKNNSYTYNRKGRKYKTFEDVKLLFLYHHRNENRDIHCIEGDNGKLGRIEGDSPYSVIHRIAVKYHGRGIVDFCFNECFLELPNIKIDTHRDNIPMQKCLLRNGFEYCGIIYLKDGTERLAYQKEK